MVWVSLFLKKKEYFGFHVCHPRKQDQDKEQAVETKYLKYQISRYLNLLSLKGT